MGSLNLEKEDGNKEINVFVTGFGPFGDNHTNPSYLIASSLPTKHSTPNHPPIIIHTHPTPITVAYESIRETIPNLIFSDASKDASSCHPHGCGKSEAQKSLPKFDIVLHIGMAPGRSFFTLETCAHRDGYKRKDVNGETLEGDTFWKDKYDAPKILLSSFDTVDVLRRWKLGLKGEDLRSSNDAGYYLCDFTYYTSMVEYWRHDPTGPRPVMFLHVPSGYQKENVERGKQVTLGLLSALVESHFGR